MATIRDRYILEVDTTGSVRNMGAAATASGTLGGALGRIGPLATAAAGALAAIGAGQFVSNVVEATAAYQDLMTTLETVTGGSAEAAAAFQQIQDFATTTPFDVNSLTEAYIRLQNAGIEPTNDLLQTLGDAAAVSSDKVGALEAVTQLFARSVQGGLGLEDLDRLADRGINVYGILREELNLTRQDISEFGKTAEGAAQIQEALLRGFEREYGGGMARAADNLSTSLSNLGIAATNSLVAVGEGGLAGGIQYAAEAISSLLGQNTELATSLGEVLGQGIIAATDAVVGFIERIQQGGPVLDLIQTAISGVVEIFSTLYEVGLQVHEALAPLTETVLPALGAAFEFVVDVIVTVVEAIGNLITGLADAISGAESFSDGVVGAFRAVKDTVVNLVSGLVDAVIGLFQGLYDALWGNSIIRDLLDGIVGGFTELGPRLLEIIGDVVRMVIDGFGALFDAIVTGVGNAISSGIDAVQEQLERFSNWFQETFFGVEDTAESTEEALAAALNGDRLNADAVRATATEIEALTENLELLADPLEQHIQNLETSTEAYELNFETLEELNEMFEEFTDAMSELNDVHETHLEQQGDLNDLYEDYLEFMNQNLEQLREKTELLTAINEQYPLLTENINTFMPVLQSSTDLVNQANSAIDEFIPVVEDLESVYDDVEDVLDGYNDTLRDYVNRTNESTRSTDQLAQALNRVADAARQAQSAADAANRSIQQAISSQERLNSMPRNNTTSPGRNTGTSSSGNWFTNLFDGWFADGGFINPGKFGIVGERGPEIVTGPANITPLDQLGGGTTNVTYNISAVDAQSFRNLVARDPEFIHAVALKGASKTPGRR